MPKKQIPVKKKRKTKPVSKPTWVACGFDVSMSVIAGAAIGFDGTLGRLCGPVFVERRWQRNTDYFKRLSDAAHAATFIHDLIAKLLLTPELVEIHIAVEEPVPMGLFKRGESGWVKQQCQISGAFLGGLVRYGYPNIYEINNMTWKQPIAFEMDTTVRNPNFKFIIEEWGRDVYPNVPEFPPLIENKKLGKIPKPETSKAKPIQPDDRYDALGVMGWMQSEIEEGNIVLTRPVKEGKPGGLQPS